MSLDIDFENFQLESSRKEELRKFIEALKQESWVTDLKHLVTELGTQENDTSENPGLPGIVDSSTDVEVYRVPENHPAFGLKVELQSSELKVHLGTKIAVELSFLPKGNEFIVYFIDEALFEEFKIKMMELADLLKEARSKKSSRQAEWKSRFNPQN